MYLTFKVSFTQMVKILDHALIYNGPLDDLNSRCCVTLTWFEMYITYLGVRILFKFFLLGLLLRTISFVFLYFVRLFPDAIKSIWLIDFEGTHPAKIVGSILDTFGVNFNVKFAFTKQYYTLSSAICQGLWVYWSFWSFSYTINLLTHCSLNSSQAPFHSHIFAHFISATKYLRKWSKY